MVLEVENNNLLLDHKIHQGKLHDEKGLELVYSGLQDDGVHDVNHNAGHAQGELHDEMVLELVYSGLLDDGNHDVDHDVGHDGDHDVEAHNGLQEDGEVHDVVVHSDLLEDGEVHEAQNAEL